MIWDDAFGKESPTKLGRFATNRLDVGMKAMDAKPIVGAMAVLFRDGKFLMIRRSKEPDSGLWSFPAGKIENGETIRAAALRELAEETGISAQAGDVITAVDAIEVGLDGRTQHHFVIIAVSCNWQDGEPVAGDDAAEAGWFAPAELFSLDLASGFDVKAVATIAMARKL